MKLKPVDYYYILIILIGIPFIIWQGYMFYSADCLLVKEFWYLVQTPGRCLMQ